MENSLAPIQFYVDQPARWGTLERCQIIRGWCFGATGEPLCGIRVQAAGRVYHGVTGRPRPDVKAAFPEAPNDFTGFEIRATLPSGSYDLSIEALLMDGSWRTFLTQRVKIPRSWWPRWLGGGSPAELIAFQMPAHATHVPKPLQREKFPAARRTDQPAFAIVTPSYNQARFLGETVRSLLSQTIAVDYVVQDGGSTDGSVKIIRGFAEEEQGAGSKERINCGADDRGQRSVASTVLNEPSACSMLPSPVKPRLLHWSSAPDGGQADAIARGFARTSGGPDDLMAWINSDDFYLPGALGYVADYFARHPEVDVIYGHRILVDANSHEIGRWFLPKHDPEVLKLNDFVPQETLFWRRRIWDRVGGLDTSFQFAMDWDLLLRFQEAGANIVRVPYFLACFRIHSAQKTSAQMHSVGQAEIDHLRTRSQGRAIPPEELENHPVLLRYLRRSARRELWGRLRARFSWR